MNTHIYYSTREQKTKTNKNQGMQCFFGNCRRGNNQRTAADVLAIINGFTMYRIHLTKRGVAQYGNLKHKQRAHHKDCNEQRGRNLVRQWTTHIRHCVSTPLVLLIAAEVPCFIKTGLSYSNCITLFGWLNNRHNRLMDDNNQSERWVIHPLCGWTEQLNYLFTCLQMYINFFKMRSKKFVELGGEPLSVCTDYVGVGLCHRHRDWHWWWTLCNVSSAVVYKCSTAAIIMLQCEWLLWWWY